MHIVELSTRQNIEVVVEEVTGQDLKTIKQSKRFGFNWDKLKKLELYKLIPAGSNDILGMMALINHPTNDNDSGFIEFNLVESAKEYTGKNKKFDRVAGNLLAHACR